MGRLMSLALIGLLTLLSVPARASEFGTKDEAVAMVKKALALIDSVGLEKSEPQIRDANGPFRDRDLYVTIVKIDGTRLVHPTTPKLEGKNMVEAMDVNGKAYGKEVVDLIQTKGSGWVDYTFVDPVSRKLLPKSVYVERKGEIFALCGVYIR